MLPRWYASLEDGKSRRPGSRNGYGRRSSWTGHDERGGRGRSDQVLRVFAPRAQGARAIALVRRERRPQWELRSLDQGASDLKHDCIANRRSLTSRADLGQEDRSTAQRLARTTYRSGLQCCRGSNKGRQHRIGSGELADSHARRLKELIILRASPNSQRIIVWDFGHGLDTSFMEI